MSRKDKVSLKDLEGYETLIKLVNVITLCLLLVAVITGGVGLFKMIIGLPCTYQIKVSIYFLIAGAVIRFLPIMIIDYIINKFN